VTVLNLVYLFVSRASYRGCRPPPLSADFVLGRRPPYNRGPVPRCMPFRAGCRPAGGGASSAAFRPACRVPL